MADWDALTERLDRALDRIERAVAQRTELMRERDALNAAQRTLEDRCNGLEQAGKEASTRLAGAIAGIDRLLRPQQRKDATPQ